MLAGLDARRRPRFKIGGTGEFRFYEGKSFIKIRVGELKPPARVGLEDDLVQRSGRVGRHDDHARSASGRERHCAFLRAPRLRASRRRLRACDDRLGLLSRQLTAVSREAIEKRAGSFPKDLLTACFRTSRRPTLRHAADDIGDVNGPRPRCRAPRQPRSQRGGRGGARSWNGRGAGEAECCSQEIAARQI